jgi:hypothetical protein
LRKLVTCLALSATSFALVASTAEASSTSEREGRKFSRKYVNSIVRDGFRDLGWKQRDCYRIGRQGVGLQGSFPRGVACLFSSTKNFGQAPCWLLGVAVKDGKRLFQAEAVTRTPFPYHGDAADCEPDAPSIEWPLLPTWTGIVGEPLRPIV